MLDSEKPELIALVKETMAGYGKPLPETVFLNAWIKQLAPFSMATIRAAISMYTNTEGTFEPKPVGIALNCKLLDGRPEAEEAWAMALLSTDEAETVVWTQEMAEAFNIARPVLDSSGAISARKSFLEAYQRLIDVARYQLLPPIWIVSEGFDKGRKKLAVKDAQRKGLLQAPQAVALLASPVPLKNAQIDFTGRDEAPDDSSRAKLAAVKKMLADMQAAKQAKIDATPSDAEIEDQRRAEIDEQVRRYASQRHDIGLAAPGVIAAKLKP